MKLGLPPELWLPGLR